jgi:hypothetical protein
VISVIFVLLDVFLVFFYGGDFGTLDDLKNLNEY